MRPIHLILITSNGDELGRLPLSGLAVGTSANAPSAAGVPPVRPQLAGYVDTVIQRSEAALAAEGLTAAFTPVQFRLAVAQALGLSAPPGAEATSSVATDEPPVFVTVPIQSPSHAAPEASPRDSSREPGADNELEAFVLGAFDDNDPAADGLTSGDTITNEGEIL